MGKIFVLVGKSCSGKDTVFKEIINRHIEELECVVPYTTRPMRPGETDGKEYHFVSEEDFFKALDLGIIIEKRSYKTSKGTWFYGTPKMAGNNHFIMIGTPEVIQSLRSCYPNNKTNRIIAIYLNPPEKERIERIKRRDIDFAETCRRYLADEEDFKDFSGGFVLTSTDRKRVVQDVEDIIKAYKQLSYAEQNIRKLRLGY